MSRNTWTWIGVCGLALSALVVFFTVRYPGALVAEDGQMRLVYLVLLLVLVGSSVIVGWRQRAGLALRQALIWIAIGLALVIVYAFRGEVETLTMRIAGELAPASAVEVAPGHVRLTRARDGHFHAHARVNGTPVRFLVDTGASDVALSAADARRLGIDLSTLRFDRLYATANGRIAAARVRLDEVTIGSVTVRDVAASVSRDGQLEQSLLGMSFLGALASVRFDGDRLTLEQ